MAVLTVVSFFLLVSCVFGSPPSQCKTNSGNIYVGETSRTSCYVSQCTENGLKLLKKGCRPYTSRGKSKDVCIDIGDTFEWGGWVYKCIDDPPFVYPKAIVRKNKVTTPEKGERSCAHPDDDSKLLLEGNTYKTGCVTYICTKDGVDIQSGGCERMGSKSCVAVNTTYEYDGWQMKCIQKDRHFVTVPFRKATVDQCRLDGAVIRLGQTHMKGCDMYRCTEGGLSITQTGCQDKRGSPGSCVKEGTSYTMDGWTYSCERGGNALVTKLTKNTAKGVVCKIKGASVDEGQTYRIGCQIYKCEKNGAKLIREGCPYYGQKVGVCIDVNKTYIYNEFEYKCVKKGKEVYENENLGYAFCKVGNTRIKRGQTKIDKDCLQYRCTNSGAKLIQEGCRKAGDKKKCVKVNTTYKSGLLSFRCVNAFGLLMNVPVGLGR